MKKYEYITAEGENSKHAEQIMNGMAKDGWRVVSTSVWKNMKILIIITFEREILS